MWAVLEKYTTTHLIATQVPGHMDAWMTSQVKVSLIHELRGPLMCLAYFFFFFFFFFFQTSLFSFAWKINSTNNSSLYYIEKKLVLAYFFDMFGTVTGLVDWCRN